MKGVIIIVVFMFTVSGYGMAQTLQTVTNNGNTTTNYIGVGTSSLYSWGSGNAVVQLGNTGGLLRGTSGGDLYLAGNGYYNGSNWIIANSSSLWPVIGFIYDGRFIVQNAQAGAVGSTWIPNTVFSTYHSGSIYSAGQGRFAGWYNSGESTGPAAEIGLSNDIAYVLGYDRTAASYIPLILAGGNSSGNIDLRLDNTGATFKSDNATTIASISDSGQIYANYNNSIIDYLHATVRLDNANTSGQTSIYFTNGGSQNGSIRVNAAGDFVMNANSGNYYFSNDFGTNVNLIAGNIRFLFANSTTGFVGLGGITNPDNVLSLPNSQYIAWKNAAGTGESAGITVGTDNAIHIYNNRMGIVVGSNGYVGIGTTIPQSMLAVAGTVTAKQVTVIQTGWSDYVFDPAYRLPNLSATSAYIKANHHLPDIPSAKEIESKGLNLGDMEKKQMQKIEELTLYQIAANRRINHLEKDNKALRYSLNEYQRELSALKVAVEQLQSKNK